MAHRLFKRYGDPRGLADGSPERAFADLWRKHCSAQFLQAQLDLLALVPAVRMSALVLSPAALRSAPLLTSNASTALVVQVQLELLALVPAVHVLSIKIKMKPMAARVRIFRPLAQALLTRSSCRRSLSCSHMCSVPTSFLIFYSTKYIFQRCSSSLWPSRPRKPPP